MFMIFLKRTLSNPKHFQAFCKKPLKKSEIPQLLIICLETKIQTIISHYIFICFRLLRTKDKKSERSISKQIFAFSILYLFAIFISILVDKFA